MHQNCQNPVKTSKLEDQYAIIFGLALWPQEPCEVHFFKRVGFHKNSRLTITKKPKNWHEMGPRESPEAADDMKMRTFSTEDCLILLKMGQLILSLMEK